MTRLFAFVESFVSMVLVLLLSACTKEDESSLLKMDVIPQTEISTTAPDQFLPKPTKIRKASSVIAGTCAVDRINNEPTTSLQTLSRTQSITIEGWIKSASERNPAPPLVLAGLSSTLGTFYMEGVRTSRHDVAIAFNNPALEYAGYKISGRVANVPNGTYKLTIVTGMDYLIYICPTDISVQVRD